MNENSTKPIRLHNESHLHFYLTARSIGCIANPFLHLSHVESAVMTGGHVQEEGTYVVTFFVS